MLLSCLYFSEEILVKPFISSTKKSLKHGFLPRLIVSSVGINDSLHLEWDTSCFPVPIYSVNFRDLFLDILLK